MNSSMYRGVAQGLNNVGTQINQKEEKDLRLQQAKAMQEQSQLQLEEYKNAAPTRAAQNDVALQQAKGEAKAINQQNLKSLTVSSLDRYAADNNVRHLNVWLESSKQNPVGASIYGEVARYDAVSQSPETDKLLRSAGYVPEDIYSDKELANDLIVVTNNNGTQSLLPRETLYAATGYNKYLTDQQLTNLERQARINQMLRSGETKTRVDLKERVVNDLVESGKAKDLGEAYTMMLEMEKSGKGTNVLSSTEERAIARIQEDNNVDYITALDMYHSTRNKGSANQSNERVYIENYMAENSGATYDEAASSYRNLAKTSTQKEVESVKFHREALDKYKWLEPGKDFSEAERNKIYRDHISPLEDLRNFKLTAEEKRAVRTLRNLTQLGATAGEKLTPAETGLLDKSLNSVKSYLVDEVGGKEATSAYETFRNIYRNALYGASLTTSEIDSFNAAAGTLKQQFKPVMQQLKTQMSSIKSNLEAIRDLNDPDIAQYYTGGSIDQIDDAIAAIEERLDSPMFSGNQFLTSEGMQNVGGEQSPITAQPAPPTPSKTPSTEAPVFDFDAAMKAEGIQ